MKNFELVGILAAILTTSAFVPQVLKTWKQKSTKDISLVMHIILATGLSLWVMYGFYQGSIAIILANIITGLMVLSMIFFKLKYK